MSRISKIKKHREFVTMQAAEAFLRRIVHRSKHLRPITMAKNVNKITPKRRKVQVWNTR